MTRSEDVVTLWRPGFECPRGGGPRFRNMGQPATMVCLDSPGEVIQVHIKTEGRSLVLHKGHGLTTGIHKALYPVIIHEKRLQTDCKAQAKWVLRRQPTKMIGQLREPVLTSFPVFTLCIQVVCKVVAGFGRNR